jgi:hypothetical protein
LAVVPGDDVIPVIESESAGDCVSERLESGDEVVSVVDPVNIGNEANPVVWRATDRATAAASRSRFFWAQ